MPHFSPISWLITGFLFYFLLFMFVSLFWWMQNFSFPHISMISNNMNIGKWDWS